MAIGRGVSSRIGRGGVIASALAVTVVGGLMLNGVRPATTGEVTLSGAPGVFNVQVRSVKENKFRNIIRQQYDFSCGSAAIASLLTYHYGVPTTEEEVFRSMWNRGDQAKISRYGFSLLDMKASLARRGLAADGFRVPLDKLEEAKIPAVTLIDTSGYKHFVVIKGLSGDEVLVGDPALGTRVIPRQQFEAIWSGILFVLRNYGEVGREYFNREDTWEAIAKTPFDSARFREDLGSFTMNLPGPGEF